MTPPSKRTLSADLEEEFAALMGDTSVDTLLASQNAPQPVLLEVDSRHDAVVVKLDEEYVFLSVGGLHDAVIPVRNLPEPPTPGQILPVIIAGFNRDDDLYEVRIPGGAIEVEDWSDLADGSVVEARITGSNQGGLECQVGGIRGFIPASQIALHRVENLAEFHDQRLRCVITEANPSRRNLVLSHRAVLEREREESRQQLLESLAPGQVCEGVVRRLQPFGAFVDLGGVDGLIHVSQMSWERIKHPSEMLEEGQRVKVKIEKIDPETGKIGLSLRDLQANPWDTVAQRFPIHGVFSGVVTRIAKFGAFVKLEAGIEGLVHISELAHHRVFSVENVVQEGQEVEVKILSVDPENQKVSLSLKQAQAMAPAAQPEEAETEEDEAPSEPLKPLAPPRNKKLKGGTSRGTGGEAFGINW